MPNQQPCVVPASRRSATGYRGVLLTLTNRTNRRIGVDLRSYWGAIYPSQWVLTRGPHRDLIDEEAPLLPVLTDADRRELNEAFHAGQLTVLSAHATRTVFSLFNGRSPESPSMEGRHYLIVPLVGLVLHLPLTPQKLPGGILLLFPPGIE